VLHKTVKCGNSNMLLGRYSIVYFKLHANKFKP